MESTTTDSLFGGAIRMNQYVTGYRYSIDPVLLAHFIRPGVSDRVTDLGTGSGIIPVILAFRYPGLSIWGIEIQKRLADLAWENIRENKLSHAVTIINGDMTRPSGLPEPGHMDYVVSNPPYVPFQAGRLNPSSEKAMARHELTITLQGLVQAAVVLLKKEGRFALIFPRNRLEELMAHLKASGLEPQRLRNVHPLAQGPPKLVLVEAVKDGRPDLTVEPPLFIYQSQDTYSDEVKMMFR